MYIHNAQNASRKRFPFNQTITPTHPLLINYIRNHRTLKPRNPQQSTIPSAIKPTSMSLRNPIYHTPSSCLSLQATIWPSAFLQGSKVEEEGIKTRHAPLKLASKDQKLENARPISVMAKMRTFSVPMLLLVAADARSHDTNVRSPSSLNTLFLSSVYLLMKIIQGSCEARRGSSAILQTRNSSMRLPRRR